MRRNRLLTLLALLITAATGAWAEAWTGGTYTATTNEDLSAINVSSDATLTINSNVTVTVNGGITIAAGKTLTVKGPGTLEVKGGNGNNGSSGQYGNPGGQGGAAVSGTIVVQDGANVMATGGKGGNGGVGWELSGPGGQGGAAFSGAVTIYDGTISASGGNGGDGDCGSGDGSDGGPGGYAFAGTLTYYGGSVTATGGNGGNGIDGDANPGKAFANANSVSFQTNDYILTSNGSAIQTIGGQKQITIAAPPVAVTGVTLPSTATVTLGDAVALTAAVAPADATDKKVKWSVTSGSDKVKLYKDAECKTEVGTDATDVLTVYVKGLAVGDATVKVESNADATKSATCAVTAKHGTYAVAMKAGVTDGDQWTARAGGSGAFAAMPLKGVEGGTKPVELKYAGDRVVKRVTATVTPKWKGDLTKILAADLESDGTTLTVENGTTLTGELAENYRVVIADGATVTLDGVTISGVNDTNCPWAGLTCLGDATIMLKDGSVNTVKGFHENYPGICVPVGKTLTIDGPGKLTASSNGKGAGIGGGYAIDCGNITIAATVGKVKGVKGADAPNSIGAGGQATCGTVTIGGTIYYDGSDYQNGGDTYLTAEKTVYPAGNTIDLHDLTADTELQDDDVVTGTLNGETQKYKITIADGAEVTLDGATINGVNDDNCKWAGLTCLGDATIILKDGTANTVKGFHEDYPGIHVPSGKTLTIQGTGSLTASSNGYGAGIGGGNVIACGNIVINSGNITATGVYSAAGIGAGGSASCGYITINGGNITATGGGNGAGIGTGDYGASCGDININGGTVSATGGDSAAGIGGGWNGTTCGAITITDGVTLVTATKGASAPYSIGAGKNGAGYASSCGTVTIGSTVYWQNNAAQNGGGTYLAQDEIVYTPSLTFAANEYNEASWDGSKVVFTKKTAASTPTAVANSNTAVTWSDGWYTVAGEVTINGKVTLGADTYLILQDGAKLTINGQLNANTNQKNLYIYGQKKGDGKLNVICSSDDAISGKSGKTVEIHGGEITAEGQYEGLHAGYIKVFSGKITAICSDVGYMGIDFMNSCDVYGGEIEATANNFVDTSRGISDGGYGGTFTVYGGKMKATGSGVEMPPYYGSGFEGKVKSGTAGIKFYFSDNGTDWDEGTYYGTATAAPRKKYAKAE